MGLFDILWCIFLPPFASGVRERGCGMMLLVLLLTCCLWLPGTIVALIMTNENNKAKRRVATGG